MLKVLYKFDRIIGRIIKWFLILVFVLMAIVAMIQVFFRFVLGSPLTWTDEFCRYSLIWLTLLGIGVAAQRKSHISIDLIKNVIPPKAAAVLEKFWNICVIVFCIVVIRYGYELVILNMAQYSAGMHIQLGYIYLALPLGGAIIIYYTILQLLGLDKKLAEMEKEGA